MLDNHIPPLPPDADKDFSKKLSVDNFLAERMSMYVDNEKEWLDDVWEKYHDQLVCSWAASL